MSNHVCHETLESYSRWSSMVYRNIWRENDAQKRENIPNNRRSKWTPEKRKLLPHIYQIFGKIQ